MKSRKILYLFLLFICSTMLLACNGNNGTEGLKYLPLNDKECAVSVGDAKTLTEIVFGKGE